MLADGGKQWRETITAEFGPEPWAASDSS